MIISKADLLPWRSAPLAAVVLLAALVAGVPLFVRMPPWCDLTLYDVAARTVIAGGTHFEDVFDTNLPGFVWSLIGIRRACGSSFEAVRIVDLLIVAASTGLLMRFVRRAGADWASTLWLAAAVALFYPFTSEFSHCQRDVWMTLPILLAVSLRVHGCETPWKRSRLEGAIWGVAVWFKPHVLIIALAVWLVTRSARNQPRRQDFLGNLAGGAMVGALGAIALLLTGTWKPMMIVMTKWNANYLITVWAETGAMAMRFFTMFEPWSLLHLLGLPLAIRAVRVAALRRRVLATLYLAVLLQACLLQRNFDYVHIPEMLLLFAVLTLEVPRALAIFSTAFLLSTVCVPETLWQHRLADEPRMAMWSDCFRELPPQEYRQRQQALALSPEYFSAINMVEIGEVADWLRSQRVQDGEVIAWHDTPHMVYLDLGITPRFRFMHITTTLISEANFERMTIELKKKSLPGARFIVTDLLHPMRFLDAASQARGREIGPDLLPPFFPWRLRHSWPYDQPAVFRRGRYIVHRIVDRNPKQFEFQWDVWGP